MLVIADADKPVAVAGIMGGGPTEVHAGTRNVLLETANFLPATIARPRRRCACPPRHRGATSAASTQIWRCELAKDRGAANSDRRWQPTVRHRGCVSWAGRAEPYPGARGRDRGLLGHTYSRELVTRVLTSLDFTVEPVDTKLLVNSAGPSSGRRGASRSGRGDRAHHRLRRDPDTLPIAPRPSRTWIR